MKHLFFRSYRIENKAPSSKCVDRVADLGIPVLIHLGIENCELQSGHAINI